MQREEIPTISPDETKALMAGGDAIVIDVREAHELARTGKARGALHVPLGEIGSHDFDREKTLVLYCAAGERSEMGGRILKSRGYEKVRNLGGFRDWVSNGGEVEHI